MVELGIGLLVAVLLCRIKWSVADGVPMDALAWPLLEGCIPHEDEHIDHKARYDYT